MTALQTCHELKQRSINLNEFIVSTTGERNPSILHAFGPILKMCVVINCTTEGLDQYLGIMAEQKDRISPTPFHCLMEYIDKLLGLLQSFADEFSLIVTIPTPGLLKSLKAWPTPFMTAVCSVDATTSEPPMEHEDTFDGYQGLFHQLT